MPEREEGLALAGDVPPARSSIGTTKPTHSDPAMVMMADRSSFCCWVEPLSDGDRWVFLGPSGRTHVGPGYDREDSLEAIRAVVSQWRASNGLQDLP